MKLSDLLPASSLDVSDVRIPSWLAEEFIERSSAEEDQSTATPKIFLEALLTQRPDRVVEMLQTIGIILSEAPNDELELGVVANLMNDEDVWTMLWWKHNIGSRTKSYGGGSKIHLSVQKVMLWVPQMAFSTVV